MIKEITTRIRRSEGIGIFHDSRMDVRTLAGVCKELIEKVNELTKAANTMAAALEKLKEEKE